MQRGWSAAGLLRPLWLRFPGGREELAARVGTSPTDLSSINSGKRNLGERLGSRIAAVCGVTLIELGAPLEPEAMPPTLLARLEELGEQAERGRAAVIEGLTAIDRRLSRIEDALAPLAARDSHRS